MSGTDGLLAGFPVVWETQVAWGEMDALGHVNNTAYFRYFESARIAYLERIDFLGPPRQRVGPILATTHCRFRRPLAYPDRVRVGARVTDVADDRFTMEYIVASERLGAVAAEGGGVVVCYDYEAGGKHALPEPVRRRIGALSAQAQPGGGR